jgi:hypothetical protein
VTKGLLLADDGFILRVEREGFHLNGRVQSPQRRRMAGERQQPRFARASRMEWRAAAVLASGLCSRR